MPLINRTINHSCEPAKPTERVKLETPFNLQESVEDEENREGIEGKWNDEENLKFVIFVNYYQDIFSSKYKRK